MSSWWLILLPLSPLPIGADRKVRRTPWVTYALIAINILVYLINQPDRAVDTAELFNRWGVIPSDLHPAALLTGQFVHVRLSHLFWNMLFLWVFGPLVEDALGPGTFLFLYLGGGAIAGVLHSRIIMLLAAHNEAFLPLTSDPLVGASGAISAILAPFAIRYYRTNIRLVWLPAYVFRRPSADDLQLPAVYAIAFVVLENIAGAIYGWVRPESGGVAYWAHLGGFAFGYAVAGITGLFLEGTQEYLLEDARAASARGAAGYPVAVRKYQAFLELQPNNIPVRLEYVSALTGLGRSSGSQPILAEASGDLQSIIRRCLDAGDLACVVRALSVSKRVGVSVDIPPRERLRIATTAQELGEKSIAVDLLESLLADSADKPQGIVPESPEDEIARLKLGQLLIDTDPAKAAAVLDSLIRRYPDSDWIRMARQLRSQVKSL
jgi:membrane associated rhomboid family serine protease